MAIPSGATGRGRTVPATCAVSSTAVVGRDSQDHYNPLAESGNQGTSKSVGRHVLGGMVLETTLVAVESTEFLNVVHRGRLSHGGILLIEVPMDRLDDSASDIPTAGRVNHEESVVFDL